MAVARGTFATISTHANELLSPIQDRMSVIIEKADWPVWLGEAEGDLATLNAARETLVVIAGGWQLHS